ncbi:MAG: hypothetical protein IJC75_02645 [Oscillospiraceae bacterium]|nr:hypothetical protein [Oscillospiraceae bacterium]
MQHSSRVAVCYTAGDAVLIQIGYSGIIGCGTAAGACTVFGFIGTLAVNGSTQIGGNAVACILNDVLVGIGCAFHG